MYLESGDSECAIRTLERGWFEPYCAPDYLFTDPDTVFRAEKFGNFLSQNTVVMRLTAADAPWQHGQIEGFHRTLRRNVQSVFAADPKCTPMDAVRHVIAARNELMRVGGVSPSVLVFGKNPKPPPHMGEDSEGFEPLAERWVS